MKKRLNNIKSVRALALLFIALAFTSCQSKHQHDEHTEGKEQTYTCPMHPQVIRHEPGACPICGMDLVLKTEQIDLGNEALLNTIVRPVNQTVLSSVATVHAESKSLPLNIDATGYVDYDTRTEGEIAARYSGRIEKLYIKYQYQHVKKGQLLFEVYSPELLTAQTNFIFLLNDHDSEQLVQAARQKLQLLGLTSQQIEQLEKTKTPYYKLPVYSTYDGHIHEPGQMINSAENSTMRSYQQTNMSPSIKEGMYIEKGQTIFSILNPEKVWVKLQFHSDDASLIKVGQPVGLMFDSSEGTIQAKINFIEPIFELGTKTMIARVFLNNPNHYYKVGSLVKAYIHAQPINALWIPKASVLNLGKQKIVWIKNENAFTAYTIDTGITLDEWIAIISGVTEVDEIAANAQYMADSEGFIMPKSPKQNPAH